jgi:hypothetical protein
VTKALRKALKQPDGELSLELATLELFAKPTSPLLKAFYQVRKGKPEARWPNKGQLKDTESGAVTLISLAFGCRCDSVVEVAVAPILPRTLTPPPAMTPPLAARCVRDRCPQRTHPPTPLFPFKHCLSLPPPPQPHFPFPSADYTRFYTKSPLASCTI